MDAELEQKAREMLAEAHEEIGKPGFARIVRAGDDDSATKAALLAISRALQAQPGWRVVPVEEQVEAAARAIERFNNPQWTDAQFEAWWNRDPFFCDRVTSWTGFTGTRKQKVIAEARAALAAAPAPQQGEGEDG